MKTISFNAEDTIAYIGRYDYDCKGYVRKYYAKYQSKKSLIVNSIIYFKKSNL